MECVWGVCVSVCECVCGVCVCVCVWMDVSTRCVCGGGYERVWWRYERVWVKVCGFGCGCVYTRCLCM